MPKRRLRHQVLMGSMVTFLGFCSLVPAARGSSEQVWLDYNPSLDLSVTTRLLLDLGIRKQLQDQGYLRLVQGMGVDYTVNQLKLAAGFSNYLTLNESTSDQWEIRPYQSVSAVWPRRRISLDHRFRLEERFEINTDTWDADNSLRGRYRLRFRCRLAAFDWGQFWSLTANGEVFFTLAGQEGQQQEQVRVGLGAERTFTHGRRLRFEVTWQQQGLFYDPGQSGEYIYFRLGFLRSW